MGSETSGDILHTETLPDEHDHAPMYRCGSACPVVIQRAHAEAIVENERWEARQADEQETDLNEQAEALAPVPLACSASIVHLPHAWVSWVNGDVECPGMSSEEWRVEKAATRDYDDA